MRLGAYPCDLVEGTKVREIYGKERIEERHRHRYEVNVQYRDALEKVGYKFSGMSPDGGLPEIVEIPDHPWFIGVQFHPESIASQMGHEILANFLALAGFKTNKPPVRPEMAI